MRPWHRFPDQLNLQHYNGVLSLNGIVYDEYLPNVFRADGSEVLDDGRIYARVHQRQDGASSLTDVPCSVVVPSKVPLESLRLTFRVTCAGPEPGGTTRVVQRVLLRVREGRDADCGRSRITGACVIRGSS